MADEVLLCKDCKHSRISAFGNIGSYIFEWGPPKAHWYRCSKAVEEEQQVVDPVTGPKKIKTKMKYCETERKYGKCGEHGENWVPKHKKDLFKMLKKEYHD